MNMMQPTPIEFKHVLQTYWEFEEFLSGSDNTCTHSCDHFQNVGVGSSNGCIGSARACEAIMNFEDEIKIYRNQSSVDRVLEGYGLHYLLTFTMDHYGRHPTDGTKVTYGVSRNRLF